MKRSILPFRKFLISIGQILVFFGLFYLIDMAQPSAAQTTKSEPRDRNAENEPPRDMDRQNLSPSKTNPKSNPPVNGDSETVKEDFQADNSSKVVPRSPNKDTTFFNLPLLDLQPYLKVEKMEIQGEKGDKGQVHLINLNENANAWYLLRIEWPNQHNIDWYHLENSRPNDSRVSLELSFPSGVVIRSDNGQRVYCDLWSAADGYRIKLAKFRKSPYVDLCKDQLFLRNRIEGYRTTKEWIVEFLRDQVWGGETITNLVKNTIYKDKFLIDGKVTTQSKPTSDSVKKTEVSPLAAQVNQKFKNHFIEAVDLDIEVLGVKDKMMELGLWYRSTKQPGVYLSVMEAQAIDETIMTSFKKYVKQLDPVESKAVNYLIAFDMTEFQVHFAMGTEHPRVEWSERVRPQYIDSNLVGPDGIKDLNPLASTGLIPPQLSENIVATFTGGFKRSHGAFKWGPLSRTNYGHHYGFMENGVVLSRLQNQLATFIVYNDQRVEMKTWEESDNARLHEMKHARQNGVAIIEYDETLKKGVPGAFVSNWTLGNWSGSQDSKFRTLRAGFCLQSNGSRRYLIYGYFSSVTPTAMARIFQSYSCDYAMHLDMNALEHTYLAAYALDKTKDNTPNHLIKGMKVLDERFKGNVPRFIGYPDNRDFFYLTRKK